MKKFLSAVFCVGLIMAMGSSVCAKTKKQYNVNNFKSSPVKDAEYYYFNGNDYDRKNNRLGATGEYTKALNLDSDCDKARISRATFLYFEGCYDKALEDFNYFYEHPSYGATVFYEYRIDSKLKLGMVEEALDDMYEVIIAYGGHAKLLQQMIDIVKQRPELQYKLTPQAHQAVIANYGSQARALRDYAQVFASDKYGMKNSNYYNFFIGTARALDPYVCLYVDSPTAHLYRTSNHGDVVETIQEQK